MARQPQRRSAWREWSYFFFGSPQRFGWTIVGVMVALAVLVPPLFALIVGNVLAALAAAFGPSADELLGIAVAVGALAFVLWAVFGKKGKKKDKH